MKSKVTLGVTRRAALLLLLSTLTPQLSTVFAQGTAFSYTGQLTDNRSPANGNYNLRFAVFDAASGGPGNSWPLLSQNFVFPDREEFMKNNVSPLLVQRFEFIRGNRGNE